MREREGGCGCDSAVDRLRCTRGGEWVAPRASSTRWGMALPLNDADCCADAAAPADAPNCCRCSCSSLCSRAASSAGFAIICDDGSCDRRSRKPAAKRLPVGADMCGATSDGRTPRRGSSLRGMVYGGESADAWLLNWVDRVGPPVALLRM